MDVLKYFYEEPIALETLSGDLDADARRRQAPAGSLDAFLNAGSERRFARAYLAGTDRARGRIGLTALGHPEAFVAPLMDLCAGARWLHADAAGTITHPDDDGARAILRAPSATALLACAETSLDADAVQALAGTARRYALTELRTLLDAARLVLFPEPAHHGFDWSIFAAEPLRVRLVAAFRRHPVGGVRRFVLPFQRARSEHQFYFEAWRLDEALPDYVEEL